MPPTSLKQGLGVALVLAVLSAAAAGCGGSNDASQFLGTWMITQGTATITCPGNQPFMANPAGNVEFAPGTTTALVAISPAELDSASFCDFAFDVSGATAKINTKSQQSCTLVSFSLAPFMAKLAPDATWTFSLTGPNAAEETGSGTLQLPTVDSTGAGTGVIPCTYTGHMATLTRVARN